MNIRQGRETQILLTTIRFSSASSTSISKVSTTSRVSGVRSINMSDSTSSLVARAVLTLLASAGILQFTSRLLGSARAPPGC